MPPSLDGAATAGWSLALPDGLVSLERGTATTRTLSFLKDGVVDRQPFPGERICLAASCGGLRLLARDRPDGGRLEPQSLFQILEILRKSKILAISRAQFRCFTPP